MRTGDFRTMMDLIFILVVVVVVAGVGAAETARSGTSSNSSYDHDGDGEVVELRYGFSSNAQPKEQPEVGVDGVLELKELFAPNDEQCGLYHVSISQIQQSNAKVGTVNLLDAQYGEEAANGLNEPFFVEKCLDGSISKVLFSAHETASTRALKQGLINLFHWSEPLDTQEEESTEWSCEEDQSTGTHSARYIRTVNDVKEKIIRRSSNLTVTSDATDFMDVTPVADIISNSSATIRPDRIIQSIHATHSTIPRDMHATSRVQQEHRQQHQQPLPDFPDKVDTNAMPTPEVHGQAFVELLTVKSVIPDRHYIDFVERWRSQMNQRRREVSQSSSESSTSVSFGGRLFVDFGRIPDRQELLQHVDTTSSSFSQKARTTNVKESLKVYANEAAGDRARLKAIDDTCNAISNDRRASKIAQKMLESKKTVLGMREYEGLLRCFSESDLLHHQKLVLHEATNHPNSEKRQEASHHLQAMRRPHPDIVNALATHILSNQNNDTQDQETATEGRLFHVFGTLIGQLNKTPEHSQAAMSLLSQLLKIVTSMKDSCEGRGEGSLTSCERKLAMCMQALINIGHSDALDTILSLLAHPTPAIQNMAVMSMRKLPFLNGAVDSHLLDVATDNNVQIQVRETAISVIKLRGAHHDVSFAHALQDELDLCIDALTQYIKISVNATTETAEYMTNTFKICSGLTHALSLHHEYSPESPIERRDNDDRLRRAVSAAARIDITLGSRKENHKTYGSSFAGASTSKYIINIVSLRIGLFGGFFEVDIHDEYTLKLFAYTRQFTLFSARLRLNVGASFKSDIASDLLYDAAKVVENSLDKLTDPLQALVDTISTFLSEMQDRFEDVVSFATETLTASETFIGFMEMLKDVKKVTSTITTWLDRVTTFAENVEKLAPLQNVLSKLEAVSSTLQGTLDNLEISLSQLTKKFYPALDTMENVVNTVAAGTMRADKLLRKISGSLFFIQKLEDVSQELRNYRDKVQPFFERGYRERRSAGLGGSRYNNLTEVTSVAMSEVGVLSEKGGFLSLVKDTFFESFSSLWDSNINLASLFDFDKPKSVTKTLIAKKKTNNTSESFPRTGYMGCLVGTCGYYGCLEQDFQCGAEGYLQGYGTKFCELYQNNADKFSPKGQQWISETKTCLQLELDSYLVARRKANLVKPSCDTLRTFAFDTHVGCYTSGESVCLLSPGDWFDIFVIIKSSFITNFKETFMQSLLSALECGSQYGDLVADAWNSAIGSVKSVFERRSIDRRNGEKQKEESVTAKLLEDAEKVLETVVAILQELKTTSIDLEGKVRKTVLPVSASIDQLQDFTLNTASTAAFHVNRVGTVLSQLSAPAKQLMRNTFQELSDGIRQGNANITDAVDWMEDVINGSQEQFRDSLESVFNTFIDSDPMQEVLTFVDELFSKLQTCAQGFVDNEFKDRISEVFESTENISTDFLSHAEGIINKVIDEKIGGALATLQGSLAASTGPLARIRSFLLKVDKVMQETPNDIPVINDIKEVLDMLITVVDVGSNLGGAAESGTLANSIVDRLTVAVSSIKDKLIQDVKEMLEQKQRNIFDKIDHFADPALDFLSEVNLTNYFETVRKDGGELIDGVVEDVFSQIHEFKDAVDEKIIQLNQLCDGAVEFLDHLDVITEKFDPASKVADKVSAAVRDVTDASTSIDKLQKDFAEDAEATWAKFMNTLDRSTIAALSALEKVKVYRTKASTPCVPGVSCWKDQVKTHIKHLLKWIKSLADEEDNVEQVVLSVDMSISTASSAATQMPVLDVMMESMDDIQISLSEASKAINTFDPERSWDDDGLSARRRDTHRDTEDCKCQFAAWQANVPDVILNSGSPQCFKDCTCACDIGAQLVKDLKTAGGIQTTYLRSCPSSFPFDVINPGSPLSYVWDQPFEANEYNPAAKLCMMSSNFAHSKHATTCCYDDDYLLVTDEISRGTTAYYRPDGPPGRPFEAFSYLTKDAAAKYMVPPDIFRENWPSKSSSPLPWEDVTAYKEVIMISLEQGSFDEFESQSFKMCLQLWTSVTTIGFGVSDLDIFKAVNPSSKLEDQICIDIEKATPRGDLFAFQRTEESDSCFQQSPISVYRLSFATRNLPYILAGSTDIHATNLFQALKADAMKFPSAELPGTNFERYPNSAVVRGRETTSNSLVKYLFRKNGLEFPAFTNSTVTVYGSSYPLSIEDPDRYSERPWTQGDVTPELQDGVLECGSAICGNCHFHKVQLNPGVEDFFSVPLSGKFTCLREPRCECRCSMQGETKTALASRGTVWMDMIPACPSRPPIEHQDWSSPSTLLRGIHPDATYCVYSRR